VSAGDVGGARGNTLCAGGYDGWAPFAEDVGDARDDTLCAAVYVEAVEGGLLLLEVIEVMRRVLPVRWRPWTVSSVAGGAEVDALCAALDTERRGGWALFAGGAGGDALCATLYAEGCAGWAQFRGFEISIMAVFSLQSATPSPESTACSTVFQVVIMGTVIDIFRSFPV